MPTLRGAAASCGSRGPAGLSPDTWSPSEFQAADRLSPPAIPGSEEAGAFIGAAMGASKYMCAPAGQASAAAVTPAYMRILKDFTFAHVPAIASICAWVYQVFWALVPPVGLVHAAPCQLTPGVGADSSGRHGS